jgi:hypothetical protein
LHLLLLPEIEKLPSGNLFWNKNAQRGQEILWHENVINCEKKKWL